MAQCKKLVMLTESFNKMWETGKYADAFKVMFEKMAELISDLNFDDCIVDLSNSRMRIDFNLFYNNGLFVSIARPANAENDDDFFSVSHNKKKIIIDVMNHADLIKKVQEVEQVVA